MRRNLILLFLLLVSPVCFAEAFLKAGIVVHPDEDEVKDRWLLAGGYDHQAGGSLFLGFELAGGFYTDQVGPELSLNTAPINAFFNVKLKGAKGGIRPFAGAGIGLMSVLRTSGDTEDYDANIGVHFLGGFEFGGASGTAFLLEAQGQTPLGEDDSDFSWIAHIGVRF